MLRACDNCKLNLLACLLFRFQMPHITHNGNLRGHRKSSQKPSETNKISFTWNPLPPPPPPPRNEQKFALQASTLRPMCIQNTIWSLKCDFFEIPHPPKQILFVSLGFCELLRWPLKAVIAFTSVVEIRCWRRFLVTSFFVVFRTYRAFGTINWLNSL